MNLRHSKLAFTLPIAVRLEFRRGTEDVIAPAKLDLSEVGVGLPGIRCPICRWRPLRSSRWTCGDCDFPEYFFDGCGTEWNTFETGGICPGCGHQWTWTSCLACWGWTRHEDWYADEPA
ncbi:MAG: hypothetical protein AB7F88_16420 [Pyrinomonadaceae bacterium]